METLMRQIAQEVYDKNSNSGRFSVESIPYHIHDGPGSPKVKFTNLQDTPNSYYQQNGRSLIVNATSNLLEFSGAIIATTATDGFITLPTCSGTPTGIPTVGAGATVYDTSANKLWIYNGSAWKGIALT